MTKYKSEILSEIEDINEVKSDVETVLSVSENLERLQDYFNNISVSEMDSPNEDLFAKEFKIKDKKLIKSIHAFMGFFTHIYFEDREEFSLFIEDILNEKVINQEKANALNKLFQGLINFNKTLNERRETLSYKKSISPFFGGIYTRCNVRVQFKKDFTIADNNEKDYDAAKDIKALIPVADIQINVEKNNETESIIFRAGMKEVNDMIVSLTNTLKQLNAINKKVKVSGE